MFRIYFNQDAGAGGSGSGAASGGAANAALAGNPGGAAAPSAPANSGNASQAQDWTSGLNDEYKGYVQAKGFKDPSMVLESYKNIEKLMGAPKERLMTLPEKEDAPEWNDVYKRLGKPEKADDYKIDAGKDGNPEFAKWAKEVFHGANLTTKQAEMVASKWNEYVQGTQKSQMEAMAARSAQDEIALKKEWGAAFDQQINTAKKAAVAFGLQPDMIDKLESSLGFGGLMKFLNSIGSKIGESDFVSGGTRNPGFGVMTPIAAQSRIKSLAEDTAFTQKLMNGDISAKDEWDRLHTMAYQS